jgi:hypothetical protein
VFCRRDVPDGITEEANQRLKVFGECTERDRVLWIEARGLIRKSMLIDHVHLNAEGYEIWDGVLWLFVEGVLNGGGGRRRREGRRGGKGRGEEKGSKCSRYWAR